LPENLKIINMKPQLFVLKISLLFNVFSFAQSFTVNNLTYTISNTTTVSVSGYNGNVNSVKKKHLLKMN